VLYREWKNHVHKKISCYDIRLCPLTNKPQQTTVDEGESEDQDPRRKPNKRALR
jgi:hypothetical protein